jgi:type II restriction enzyme
MYCPRCGFSHIERFENNRPAADFFCPNCGNQYELKSKRGKLGNKITDGAYDTMIDRIIGSENPDFFFLTYSETEHRVNNLILILKHFLSRISSKKENL